MSLFGEKGQDEMLDPQVFDDPELRYLARAAQSGESTAPDAFLKLLRGVRALGRHDLAQPCRLIWPAGASGEALREMLLLYLDAGSIEQIRHLLADHSDLELRLPASVLVAILDALPESSQLGPLRIWPEESLPYAAKTSIFHVQEAIIARQRAMIERLLSHASVQAKAG